jgi:hypothetical protein
LAWRGLSRLRRRLPSEAMRPGRSLRPQPYAHLNNILKRSKSFPWFAFVFVVLV